MEVLTEEAQKPTDAVLLEGEHALRGTERGRAAAADGAPLLLEHPDL